MRDLDDEVVVIAGGATGIGAATAHRLARAGAHVVVGDVNAGAAERTADGIRQAGGDACAFGSTSPTRHRSAS